VRPPSPSCVASSSVSTAIIVPTLKPYNEADLILQVPNGELDTKQLRFLGDAIAPFGDAGCGDITTRANVQLRGLTLAEADQIFAGLQRVGLSSVQTGAQPVIAKTTNEAYAGLRPQAGSFSEWNRTEYLFIPPVGLCCRTFTKQRFRAGLENACACGLQQAATLT